MSLTLKKSARKDARVHVEGTSCQVSSLNSPNPYLAEIKDISQGGMSFILKQKAFGPKAVLQIQVQCSKKSPLLFTGMITRDPEPYQSDSSEGFRYSVRFDRKLSEKEFQAVIASFSIIAFNAA